MIERIPLLFSMPIPGSQQAREFIVIRSVPKRVLNNSASARPVRPSQRDSEGCRVGVEKALRET
jgi:hypothetical protein